MFLRLFLGLFILVGIYVPVVAQNSADLNIIIISEPVVDDSTRAVSVQFIVEDESIPVVDLSTDALSLSESADNIQLNTSFDRTLNLAIAVDLSFGSDADLVRDSVRFAAVKTESMLRLPVNSPVLPLTCAISQELNIRLNPIPFLLVGLTIHL